MKYRTELTKIYEYASGIPADYNTLYDGVSEEEARRIFNAEAVKLSKRVNYLKKRHYELHLTLTEETDDEADVLYTYYPIRDKLSLI